MSEVENVLTDAAFKSEHAKLGQRPARALALDETCLVDAKDRCRSEPRA